MHDKGTKSASQAIGDKMLLFLHLLEYGGQNSFIQTVGLAQLETKQRWYVWYVRYLVRVIQTTEITRAGYSPRWESPEARSNSKGRCSSSWWHRDHRDTEPSIQKQHQISLTVLTLLQQSTHINCIVSTHDSASSLMELLSEREHVKISYVTRRYFDTWPILTHLPSTFSFLPWIPHRGLSLAAQSRVYHPNWEPIMQNLPFVYRVYRTSLGVIPTPFFLSLVRSPTSTSVPPPDTRTQFQDVSIKKQESVGKQVLRVFGVIEFNQLYLATLEPRRPVRFASLELTIFSQLFQNPSESIRISSHIFRYLPRSSHVGWQGLVSRQDWTGDRSEGASLPGQHCQHCAMARCSDILVVLFFKRKIRRNGILQSIAIYCNLLQSIAIYCNLLQSIAIYCNLLQSIAIYCNLLQSIAIYCNLLQSIAIYCNLLQPIATYCNLLQSIAIYCNLLQSIAIYCNLLQSIAIYCNLLQSIAIYCNLLQSIAIYCNLLQSIAIYCNLLQSIAIYCNLLQSIAIYCNLLQSIAIYCNLLQPIAIYCNLLQSIAIYCNLLQPIAIYCNLLQSIAIYCNLLQSSAIYCNLVQPIAI